MAQISVLLIALGLLLGLRAHAETDGCCVDKDFQEAFMEHRRFSRTWPEAFPDDLSDLPFQYIGASIGVNGPYSSVAWKAEDARPDRVRETLVEALESRLWRAVPSDATGESPFARGFVTQRQRTYPRHERFCRDNDGLLTLTLKESSSSVVVTLSHQLNHGMGHCDSVIANTGTQMSMLMGLGHGLSSQLPVIHVPEEFQLQGGGGHTGGADEAKSDATVPQTDISVSELVSSFEAQMLDQGWRRGPGLNSSVASGHIWHKSSDGVAYNCMVMGFRTQSGIRLKMMLHRS